MLQLRLISPPACTDDVVRLLMADTGVVSLEVRPGAAIKPMHADVVIADVLVEHANGLIEQIQALDLDDLGELSIIEIEATRSEPAHQASRGLKGRASDVIVWTLLDSRVHQDGVPTIAFFCFMACAALIATVGIVVDSSVLIVGAMVVGPEYGPLAAFAVAVYRHRADAARTAIAVLLGGLVIAVLTATVAAFVFDLLDTDYVIASNRFFTRFVTEPNVYSAIVSFAAGMVGMIAVALGRSGALTGVVVSATTIPAAAAIGVNAADSEWDESLRGALQLGINVACLAGGSLLALVVYRIVMHRVQRA